MSGIKKGKGLKDDINFGGNWSIPEVSSLILYGRIQLCLKRIKFLFIKKTLALYIYTIRVEICKRNIILKISYFILQKNIENKFVYIYYIYNISYTCLFYGNFENISYCVIRF